MPASWLRRRRLGHHELRVVGGVVDGAIPSSTMVSANVIGVYCEARRRVGRPLPQLCATDRQGGAGRSQLWGSMIRPRHERPFDVLPETHGLRLHPDAET
jgi:hypothetical protein